MRPKFTASDHVVVRKDDGGSRIFARTSTPEDADLLARLLTSWSYTVPHTEREHPCLCGHLQLEEHYAMVGCEISGCSCPKYRADTTKWVDVKKLPNIVEEFHDEWNDRWDPGPIGTWSSCRRE